MGVDVGVQACLSQKRTAGAVLSEVMSYSIATLLPLSVALSENVSSSQRRIGECSRGLRE